MRNLLTICLGFAVLQLCGCLTFYEVKVNKPEEMKILKEFGGGTPISAYVFGCYRDHEIYQGVDKSFWMYCNGSNSDGTTYRLSRIGPGTEEYQYRKRSQNDPEIRNTLANMKKVPLAKCPEASLCGTGSQGPAMLRLQTDGFYDTRVEYVDFALKKEIYRAVMNGEPLSHLMAAGRAPLIEKELVEEIIGNIFQQRHTENNLELLRLITDKNGAAFDSYLSNMLAERKEESAMSNTEWASWFETAEGCRVQIPSIIKMSDLKTIRSVAWTGKCVDGKAEGYGTVKLSMDTHVELAGTMKRGTLEGEVESSVWDAFVRKVRTHHVHKNVAMSESEYEKARKNNSFDEIARQNDDSILDCAASFDLACLQNALDRGTDVNKKSKTGVTTIFAAITAIRNAGADTPAGVATVKWLLEHGANAQYRLNPAPAAFLHEMNAEEYLKTSRVAGIINLRAPQAPNTLALFSDPAVMEKNARELGYSRRAVELGLSKRDYLRKLGGIEDLRTARTFEGYADAFKLSGAKDDFIAAQRLAKSHKQKRALEYLAVLATKDKTKIFDISTTLNNVASKNVEDRNHSDKVLYVFNIKSKSSDATFSGKSKLRVSKESPVKLSGGYKVTVRYTLSAVVETKTSVEFIISNSSTRSETVNRTVEKAFILKQKNFEDAADLQFGTISIAGSAKVLGGTGKMNQTLKEDPVLTAEIVKVEMLND